MHNMHILVSVQPNSELAANMNPLRPHAHQADCSCVNHGHAGTYDNQQQQQHQQPPQEQLLQEDQPAYLRQRQEEVRDRIQHMKKLESTTYNRSAHAKHPFLMCDPQQNKTWRRQMIDWIASIVGHCKLQPEVVSAAAYYMDVAVSSSYTCTGEICDTRSADTIAITPQQYSCLALTSLVLALKAFDSPHQRLLKLTALVGLGDGSFDVQDVEHMERQLLRVLKWRIHVPTPNCFVNQYLALMTDWKIDDDIFDHSCESDDESRDHDSSVFADHIRTLAEDAIIESIRNPNYVHCKPSKLAQAAIGVAIQQLSQGIDLRRPPSFASDSMALSAVSFHFFEDQIKAADGIDFDTLQAYAGQWKRIIALGDDVVSQATPMAADAPCDATGCHPPKAHAGQPSTPTQKTHDTSQQSPIQVVEYYEYET